MNNEKEKFILPFEDISMEDVPLVGGKNAALGEMIKNLTPLGVRVPGGFAVTAYAYRFFMEKAGLTEKVRSELIGLNTADVAALQKHGKRIRDMITGADLPTKLKDAVGEAYSRLEEYYEKNLDTAVRSSATAEDLPGASFAGQQETYLNIKGIDNVLEHIKRCFASLFTDRAISYRADKGFDETDVALSVGVQKMIRSDLSASGVMFSIDTETGFDQVVIINSSYGLGEYIVQGKVVPDEFILFKPAIEEGRLGIIAKEVGRKDVRLVYDKNGTKEESVPPEKMPLMSISDEEAKTLAEWAIKIEKYFSEKNKRYQPMDIEWAKDGKNGELFIVQARPETVHAEKDAGAYKEYKLEEKSRALVYGIAIGTKIAAGPARVIKDASRIDEFNEGEVLVTEITDPNWEPIMKIAKAIVTDKGGRTSHAAIVSRELGIPAVVGTENATEKLNDGENITIDCSSGKSGVVYEGILKFETEEHHLDEIPKTRTKVMINIGAPDEAFRYHMLPVQGVGLGRLEFIIGSYIRLHPNALIYYNELKNEASGDRETEKLVKQIDGLTRGYKNKTDYYVDRLAEGMAKIAAAFWPNDVIIRFSDFKTNEYRTLVGGERFEPEEANPMLGWRGASRYYSEKFKKAFGLECAALKMAREEIGLQNIVPMVPFCRSVSEGQKVLDVMSEYGLDRKKDSSLKIYMMCEIPSNVILADQFLNIFDGFSIGSNDLTQLTLGLDRDSGAIASIANENDESVKELIRQAITVCKKRKKYVGICGQAPSDYPDFAEFLVREGIESISLNPDTIIKTLTRIAKAETRL